MPVLNQLKLLLTFKVCSYRVLHQLLWLLLLLLFDEMNKVSQEELKHFEHSWESRHKQTKRNEKDAIKEIRRDVSLIRELETETTIELIKHDFQ